MNWNANFGIFPDMSKECGLIIRGCPGAASGAPSGMLVWKFGFLLFGDLCCRLVKDKSNIEAIVGVEHL